MKILIITCLLYVQLIAATTNYCDTLLCTYGQTVYKHIACGVVLPGRFDRKCVSPSAGTLDQNSINTIVKTMNDLRSSLANGALGFDAAAKMPELLWDPELAILAALNTKQCEMKHDDCHNTDNFKYAGQNLAVRYQTNPFTSASIFTAIVNFINAWFDEYKNTLKSELASFPQYRAPMAPQIGHFTAMAQDKAKYVGCGYSTYTTVRNGRNQNTLLFGCNFSYTNVVGTSAYTTGVPCSQCNSGCSSTYPALCSRNEIVNSNP